MHLQRVLDLFGEEEDGEELQEAAAQGDDAPVVRSAISCVFFSVLPRAFVYNIHDMNAINRGIHRLTTTREELPSGSVLQPHAPTTWAPKWAHHRTATKRCQGQGLQRRPKCSSRRGGPFHRPLPTLKYNVNHPLL